MTSLIARLLACFLEPSPPRERPEVAPPSTPVRSTLGAAGHAAPRASLGGEERGRTLRMRAVEGAGEQWLPPSAAVSAGGDLAAPSSDVSVGGDVVAPSSDVSVGGDVAAPSSDVSVGGDVAAPSSDVSVGGDVAAPALGAKSPSAAVVGASARAVMPVAAAAAGELRVRASAPAALVALWHPAAATTAAAPRADDTGAASATGATRTVTPSGAATPAARRLEAGLAVDGSGPATSCGRVAWLLLPSAPSPAAETAARILARSAAPVVLAICGPRPAALEPLLATCDVAVAVLPVEADPDLRTLALAALPAPRRAIHPPLAPGPPRWAALAGLARLRSLPRSAGDEEGG